jgi:hypothetical protein
MKNGLIILMVFFGFSCDSLEPERIWIVHYRIYKKSSDPISYRVKYTATGGATQTFGPIDSFEWKSKDLEMKEGELAWIEVEQISGIGALDVQILRDNAVHEEGTKEEGVLIFTLEEEI